MNFRKKPVVIEAEQFLGPDFPLPFSDRGDPCYFDDGRWYILTLESDHSLTLGDWVIRGVKGEFYLCKPDIFVATYDTVDDPPAAFWNTRTPSPAVRALVDELRAYIAELRRGSSGRRFIVEEALAAVEREIGEA